MINENVIDFDQVSVSFGSQDVIENVSFSIKPNQTVCIVGESGCGKTVTLKLLIGLLLPLAGDVRFENQSISRMNHKQQAVLRQRVGFLFQQAALFDSLNVYNNVAFGLRAKGGIGEAEIEQRVSARIQDVGLDQSVLRKMPSEISGGMRKRVGLARALAIEPDVMLYDEPTTGLDPIMTDAINDLMLSVRRRRAMTSVIVTHELRTVEQVADRVIMLYPRSKLQPGEPQLIYDGPPEGMATVSDARVRMFVRK